MPSLDINNIVNDKNRVKITGALGDIKQRTSVESFIKENFNISVSNEWDGANETDSQSKLAAIINKTLAIARRSSNVGFSDIRILHPIQTIRTWRGSSLPVFNIPLTFLSLTENSNPLEDAKKLLRTVTPRFRAANFVLEAPLGYAPKFKGKGTALGTVTLEIGEWFRAPDLIILDVNINFDSAVIESGVPIMVEAAVQLSPFRLVDQNEILGYFIEQA